jgi:hypothetical protein
MKIFFRILFTLFFIIAVIAVIAPNDFRIEREITINKPIATVFTQIRFLKNHEKWNAWSLMDPSLKKDFTGTDGTVGFKSSWDSPNEELGTAEQEIKNIEENKSFETEIRFKKPFEADFDSYLTTTPINENKTKVILGMYDTMKFPITVISFVFNVCLGNQKKLEDKMDASLKALKDILEK